MNNNISKLIDECEKCDSYEMYYLIQAKIGNFMIGNNISQSTSHSILNSIGDEYWCELLDFMIACGFDVNKSCLNGDQLIHVICRNMWSSNLDILYTKLSYLISKKNVDVNTINANNETPLIIAIKCAGNNIIKINSIIQLLIVTGADINHFDNFGKCALSILFDEYRNVDDIIDCLINNGAIYDMNYLWPNSSNISRYYIEYTHNNKLPIFYLNYMIDLN